MSSEPQGVLSRVDDLEPRPSHVRPPSVGRLAMALAVAVVSDFVGLWAEVVPPLQWIVDVATALLLFMIFGRRWAILPGLVAEAIPGLGVFPVWVLVVLSIGFYDNFKTRKT